MENFFKNKKLVIKKEYKTPFCAENNVFQDGTTAIFKDVDGKFWAISGHTHMGEIAMFSCNNVKDLKKNIPYNDKIFYR